MAPMNPTAPIVWKNLIRRRKAFQRLRQSANHFLSQPKDSGQRNLTLLAANERHPQEIRNESAFAAVLDRHGPSNRPAHFIRVGPPAGLA